ncbi:MAG: hypothetical protein NTZ27_01445 [Ignavibacteriales bacterium]|nr:hypothetical protein [Ignavibacteriales bacterium]
MKKLEKTNIILQIIVGIIIIGQFIYASREIILYGLKASMPVWVLILSSLISILFGFLIPRNKSIRIRKVFEHPHIFNFDWQESNPELKGWTIEADDGKTSKPTFKLLADGKYGKVLDIKSVSSYHMDINIPALYKYAKIYEVILKPGEAYQFYALVKIISQNKKQNKVVWLAFSEGKGIPRPFADGMYEWKIDLSPDKLEYGWLQFRIDLADAVGKTYGLEGWQLDEFKLIRIRGELVLAEINIY